jgi:hypothetical protein
MKDDLYVLCKKEIHEFEKHSKIGDYHSYIKYICDEIDY